MPVEESSAVANARVMVLEDELVRVKEVIARIVAALEQIDPDDVDRLTEEGGRLAIMRRRQEEIEAELATLRGSSTPPVRALAVGHALYAAAILPDGSGVLTGGSDGMLLRDSVTGAAVRTYPLPGHRLSVAVSPDGRYVAGRHYDLGTFVFDRATGQQTGAFPDIRNQANLAFAAGSGGIPFLVGVPEDQGRTRVRFLSVAGGGAYSAGGGFSGQIVYLAVSPDARTLLASDAPGRTLLFGLPNGEPNDCPNLGGGAITAAAFAADGSAVAMGDFGGHVAVGTINEPVPGHPKFQIRGAVPSLEGDRVHDLAFSPDGRLLAVRGIQRVVLFDVSAGHPPAQVAVFEGVGDIDVVARRTLSFSPDGRWFVAAGYQGLFRGDTSQFLHPTGPSDPA